MMKPIFAFFSFLLCVNCTTIPLAQDTSVRRLVVENPSRLSMELRRVNGDSMSLGDAERTVLDLESDRYVITANGVEFSVPLLVSPMGESQTMTITLEPANAALPGFVFVPGGPTLIGDVLGVGAVDERPVHIANVDSFLVAKYETSSSQYCAFLNAQSTFNEEWLDLGGPKCHISRAAKGTFETDAPMMPVVTVSYDGATEYCKWRSSSTGRTHRLPSEIEWERIARGPESSTYAYGDTYDPDSANQESGKLMEIGSFPATGWGTFDVTGNAFEWTSSWYAPGLRVLKGGSYVLDGPYLRNSFRMWYRPLVQADDIGFRVIQEL